MSVGHLRSVAFVSQEVNRTQGYVFPCIPIPSVHMLEAVSWRWFSTQGFMCWKLIRELYNVIIKGDHMNITVWPIFVVLV